MYTFIFQINNLYLDKIKVQLSNCQNRIYESNLQETNK